MSRRRSAAGCPGSLPLLPRLGECGPTASVALFIDVLAPPSPPPANGSARGARPQPITAPLPGILPGPSSNSCGRLVTRPPAPRGAPPGGAGRRCRARPRGSPGAGPPALRDPRPSGTPGTAGPAAPGLGCRRTRKPSPTLPSARGSPCADTVSGAVAPPWPQSAGRRWGHFVHRCGEKEKKASMFAGNTEQ